MKAIHHKDTKETKETQRRKNNSFFFVFLCVLCVFVVNPFCLYSAEKLLRKSSNSFFC
jgi:hypothetical protein